MTAAVIWGSEGSLVGARVDYSSNQFNGRRVNGTTYGGIRLSAVTANVVVTLPLGSIKPYGMVGGGWYPYREAGDSKRDNDFGGTIGGGITFPFLVGAGFIEGRYHAVSGRATARTFVPITFGILF
jgi:opacity protein-like surface antigen